VATATATAQISRSALRREEAGIPGTVAALPGAYPGPSCADDTDRRELWSRCFTASRVRSGIAVVPGEMASGRHDVAIVSGPVWTEPAPLERSNGRPPIGLAAPLSDAARTGRE